MTNFRELCAELNGLLEYISDINPSLCEEEINNMTSRAKAALAQPEPQGPTDEELVELFNENDWNFISPETFIDIARSVLELK